ncbi:MAG: RecX family transcriptional regulator [Bacteroidaceae bacterium]|nr:RecX family transcriptional regulator [Bacteroidaceae bacterium]
MQKTAIPSEKEALSRAQALCSRRECCVSEIREKLTLWQQPVAVQDRIIERLQSEGYIDELRFSRAYALDKMRYNHWGRQKIAQMLRLLDVPDRDRQTALRELPDDEYLDILRRALRSKLPTIRARNDYERRGKLMRFLLGRGFEMDLIREVMEGE